jgi:hypothetical protein
MGKGLKPLNFIVISYFTLVKGVAIITPTFRSEKRTPLKAAWASAHSSEALNVSY